MNPPLAASLVTEMLDHVRDVDIAPLDPGLLEPLVEDSAGRTDERMALDVLAVARLLADHHHLGVARALAHHRLRRAFPEIASSAAVDRLSQVGEARALGDGGGRPIQARGGLLTKRGHPGCGVPER